MKVAKDYFKLTHSREDAKAISALKEVMAKNKNNTEIFLVAKRLRARLRPQEIQPYEPCFSYTFYDNPEKFCIQIAEQFRSLFPNENMADYYMRRPDKQPYDPKTIKWVKK